LNCLLKKFVTAFHNSSVDKTGKLTLFVWKISKCECMKMVIAQLSEAMCLISDSYYVSQTVNIYL